MFPYKGLIELAVALALGLPLTAECAIVNVDLKGVSNYPGPPPDPLNPTYIGQGPAGGGTNFNGVLVDSRLPGGASGDWTGGDFFLTITATDLLDSSSNATAIGFTTSPVGGDGGDAVVSATDPAALFGDYLFVGYAPHPAGATADFTVSGLGAAPAVDLYFYGNNVAPVTIAGSAPAAFAGSGIFTNGNTRYFHQVPVSGGQVAGTFGTGSIVAGFTVVTPEPRPFVKSVSPTGNAVRQDPLIEVQLQDYVTQVAPYSIQLFFNGQAVSPVINKPTGTDVTIVTYAPGILPQRSTNTFRIIFSDTGSPPVTQTNDFSFVTLSEATAAETVNIDFNGFRVNDNPASTFVGQGAAGGGTVFNGVTADSTLPDGSNDDNLTVGGTGLLNSLGDATAVSVTIAPVGGWHVGATADPTAIAALLNDEVFVGQFGQTTGTADFSINGLNSPAADLYFYLGPNSAAQPISIPGGLPSPFAGSGNFTSANTIYFSHVPVTGGHVSGTLGTTNLDFAAISGLSIVAPLPQPYVSSVSPTGRGVPTNAVITIALQDYVTQVVSNSIQLFLNGTAVAPAIAKVTGTSVTTVSYAPLGGLQPGSTNTVTIVFGDSATPPVVQTNDFSFQVIRILVGAPLAVGINFRADVSVGGFMQSDDSAGVIQTAYWNNVPGATLDVTGLIDSTGASTPANLDISSGALPYQGDNNAPAGGDKEMMTGHIYVGPGSTIDVAISGLSAAFTGPGYDLYVYYRSGSGPWLQTYAVLDDSGATVAGPVTVQDSNAIGFDGTYVESDGAGSAGHYYVFTNLSLANFTLETQPVTPPTSYAYISGLQIVARGTGAAAIMVQPRSQEVMASQPVTFSVLAAGASPLQFQWLRNGAAIQGATDSAYTIPSASTDDNNAQFSVVVSNALGTVTSRVAVLTVQLRALLAAQTTANGTRVTVAFAMPVSAATATNAGNYAISNGVTVSSAAMINPSAVVLTTSPIAAGPAYTLTVNGVQTIAGNPFTPNSQIAVAVSGVAIGINFRADADVGGLMQPEDSAGVIETANWNNLPGATLDATGLVDSTGATTPTSLSIPIGPNAYQAGNNAPAAGDNEMMTGHIYVAAPGAIDVVLSGLTAAFTGPGYDLYVYYRSGAGLFPHTYAVLDNSGTTVAGPVTVSDSVAIGFDGTYVASDGAGSGGHYYVFTDLSLGNFTLRTTSPATYAYISGLQIVAHGPRPPRVSIARDGATVTISWSGAATLQSADRVTGPWTDLTGQTSPYSITPAGPAKFYRLHQ